MKLNFPDPPAKRALRRSYTSRGYVYSVSEFPGELFLCVNMVNSNTKSFINLNTGNEALLPGVDKFFLENAEVFVK